MTTSNDGLVAGPHGRPLDRIRLAGLRGNGLHGVLPHERIEGQLFVADVVLHVDTRAAAATDELARTVNYADVATRVVDELVGTPVDLIETVAQRIASAMLEIPLVAVVDVTVHKPHAPMPVAFDDVAVEIRRDRSDLAADAGAGLVGAAVVETGVDGTGTAEAPADSAGEQAEAERVEAEQVEAEQVEAEQVEAEQVEVEQVEAEQAELGQPEVEQAEVGHVEVEHVGTEQAGVEPVEAKQVEVRHAGVGQAGAENAPGQSAATVAPVDVAVDGGAGSEPSRGPVVEPTGGHVPEPAVEPAPGRIKPTTRPIAGCAAALAAVETAAVPAAFGVRPAVADAARDSIAEAPNLVLAEAGAPSAGAMSAVAPIAAAPATTTAETPAPIAAAPATTTAETPAPIAAAQPAGLAQGKGSVPVESAPVESAPVESAPVESAPVESVPVESAPATPAEAVPPAADEAGGTVDEAGAEAHRAVGYRDSFPDALTDLLAAGYDRLPPGIDRVVRGQGDGPTVPAPAVMPPSIPPGGGTGGGFLGFGPGPEDARRAVEDQDGPAAADDPRMAQSGRPGSAPLDVGGVGPAAPGVTPGAADPLPVVVGPPLGTPAPVPADVTERPAASYDGTAASFDRTGPAVVAPNEPFTAEPPAAEPYTAEPYAEGSYAPEPYAVARPYAAEPAEPPVAAPFPVEPVAVVPHAAHRVDAARSTPVSQVPVPQVPAEPVEMVDGSADLGLGSRDRMDEVPPGYIDVVLGLGANLGDSQQTLRDAISDLDAISGLEITDVSPLARSAPAGGPDQPDYLNAVLLARTLLSARDLLHACQGVEDAHGRVRTERWGPRTLDIDIIAYGTLTDVAPDLELPHPRAHERAFVLQPWSELDPQAVLPGLGGGPVTVLAATAPDREGIRWLALDWLTERAPATGSIPYLAPDAQGGLDQPGQAPGGESVPAGSTPGGGVPAGSTPGGGVPAGSTPGGGVSAGSTPGGGVPAGSTPGGGVSSDAAWAPSAWAPAPTAYQPPVSGPLPAAVRPAAPTSAPQAQVASSPLAYDPFAGNAERRRYPAPHQAAAGRAAQSPPGGSPQAPSFAPQTPGTGHRSAARSSSVRPVEPER